MNWKKNGAAALAAVMALTGTAAMTGSGILAEASDGGTAGQEWEYKEDTITMLIDTDTSMAGIQAVCDLAEEKLGITVEIETRVGSLPDRKSTRLNSSHN